MKTMINSIMNRWLLCFGTLISYIKFGKVTSSVQATVGYGEVSEIAYYDRNYRLVGYWAYGEFDPGFEYQGEQEW